jgi:hypothetical protein
MKQMTNLDAHAWNGALKCYSAAFFRQPGGGGEIFFFYQSEEYASIFPVLADGSISRNGRGMDAPSSDEKVDIILRENLGIKEIRWAND